MADFTPRLTSAGIENNRLWYSDNPFYQSGFGLPNCTCYAWGRFWEIANGDSDKRPNLSLSDANNWYSYNDGYERSQIPALGSVLCLYGGNYSGLGHVAIVEEINSDGSIMTSESAYNAYYWELRRRVPPDYSYSPYDGYIFQGFIINPYAGDTPVPPHGDKFKWWLSEPILRRRNYAF